MRARISRWVVIAAFVSLAGATLVSAQTWYEHYDNAERALAGGKWNEAIDELQKALEKRPEPGVSVKTYGMNFVNYHPYLKLGIAYYNLGNYDAALQAFQTEELRGAIAKSATDRRNLDSFKKLAQDAKDKSGADERDRIGKAVAKNLEDAGRLEKEDHLDEALAAASRALAADPKNAEAEATANRLLSRITIRNRARENDVQYNRLMEEGRQHAAKNEFEDAAAAFTKAQSYRLNDPEARRLVDDVMARLRTKLDAEKSASEKAALLQKALADVSDAEKRGDFAAALASVQTALAIDPANRSAVTSRDRLQGLAAKAEADATRTGEVTTLLATGTSALREGRAQAAVDAFNQVLTLDPNNDAAKQQIVQAFSALRQTLSSAAPLMARIPPIVRLPWAGKSDSDFETTDSSSFKLVGAIFYFEPSVQVSLFLDSVGGPPSSNPLMTRKLTGTAFGEFFTFDFGEALDLPEGNSLLRVVATGSNLSGEASRTVRYVAPWWRSPWVIATGGAVVLCGLGALQWRRARRRKLAITRRFNPYVAGTPILKDDDFFGREALAERVLQTIHNNSLLLYGERRIGKTSLQHHIKKRLQQMQDPEYQFFPVYVDLQGLPQEKFFSTLGAETFHELAPLLPAALANKDPRNDDTYAYESFVRDLRDAVKAIQARTTKKVKVVLLIDEVDELNAYDPRINQRLRSLFMKSFAESLAAVVSGVAIKKHWESEGSPWYNFFEEVEVKPFAKKDAVDLIEKPIRGIFQLEPDVTERIIQMTDCKPYLIQKMCIALVNRLHENKRRKITLADVEAVGRPKEA